MKSTLSFVGSDLLTDTNKKIESISMSGDEKENLPELIKTLTTHFEGVHDELQNIFDSL